MDSFLTPFSGEYLYSIAAVFSFAAYVFSNIFWLRVFLIIAALLYIVAGISLGLTSMAGWNAAYLVINSYHAAMILFNRSTVMLPDQIKGIYKEAFTTLTTREFKKIITTNPYHVYKAGERIMSEGEDTNELFLLLSGTASVISSFNEIASITSGDFIGEMSFMSKQTASADVFAKNDVVVAYWTHADLYKLEQKNIKIYNKFLTIVGRDLVKKLKRKNQQIVKSV
ncbi:cyclic nucleotide-binding domain-containing protein [uncultured Cocleimonas sp.]|uniref:cyclic nucleotide-binding domain-containing protein n=1 Tax=uncultured Cocleimonas sp. TaxID=1051587 RepID=UPI00263115FA|nr:cyclic nucleotide-binding domain-containing protein [uncultured Cocleimonas sp.]